MAFKITIGPFTNGHHAKWLAKRIAKQYDLPVQVETIPVPVSCEQSLSRIQAAQQAVNPTTIGDTNEIP